MEKNIKLLFCILGGIILILLSNPLCMNIVSYIFSSGSFLQFVMKTLINIVSFLGIIIVIICSIKLILNNIKLK
jgi:hypothetical protein